MFPLCHFNLLINVRASLSPTRIPILLEFRFSTHALRNPSGLLRRNLSMTLRSFSIHLNSFRIAAV